MTTHIINIMTRITAGATIAITGFGIVFNGMPVLVGAGVIIAVTIVAILGVR